MSFLKSLFGFGGGSSGAPATPKTIREVEHNGYKIEAQPYAESGQFQVAGLISKTIGGESKVHRFVRADRFGSIDDAAEISLLKARQMIDQQGDRIFDA